MDLFRTATLAEVVPGESGPAAEPNHAAEVVTVVAPDGTIRYESPAIEALLGYRPHDLLGSNAFALVHPDDRVRASRAFAEALRAPDVAQRVSFRFRHRDGSWRALEATCGSLFGDADEGAS